jgi:hypothetical protein
MIVILAPSIDHGALGLAAAMDAEYVRAVEDQVDHVERLYMIGREHSAVQVFR